MNRKKYVWNLKNNWHNINEYKKCICAKYYEFPSIKIGEFVEEYENALVLNKMLEEFRINVFPYTKILKNTRFYPY
ncbi:hypothetical protein [Anaerococcus senegalensis]|uniref:hypothetical protein n=1 Tax=Anaerococcus senegalensis TaxID=1288120 RepID=UPI00058B9AB0|nr:hypothetical protein [Anaerococcus senegalensis]